MHLVGLSHARPHKDSSEGKNTRPHVVRESQRNMDNRVTWRET